MGHRTNEFDRMHPIVNAVYFLVVIGFSMFLMHPMTQLISFVCAFLYSVQLKGKRSAFKTLFILLPVILLAALMNPVFNHKGATILTYLPGGNPLTLESILYGISAGLMLATVICWFSCLHEIMTSDKLVYLTGRMTPSLSLVFSMTLRFVPRFGEQFKKVRSAQKYMGKDYEKKGFIHKMKREISVLSSMVTWSLENAIDTADSMKSRGYGLPGRTAFSVFAFDRRDAAVLAFLALFAMYVGWATLTDKISFQYFPMIRYAQFNGFTGSVFLSYLLLCGTPIFLELWEGRKWNF